MKKKRTNIDALLGMSGAPKSSNARSLSPFGTAAEAFAKTQGSSPPRPAEAAGLALLEQRAHAHDLAPETVSLAWDLAGLQPDLGPGARRHLTYLVVMALAGLREGSTRIPVSSQAGRAYISALLETLAPHEERVAIAEGIRSLLDEGLAPQVVSADPEAYAPLILHGDHLYLQRMWALEGRLVRAYAQKTRAVVPPRAELEAALASVLEHAAGRFVPSPEQALAVRRASTEPLTVISGGPGTGKTSIVVAILSALVRSGVAPENIALAAPTGKAAHRLDEAIRSGLDANAPSDVALRDRLPAPRTLHRLLGYSPGADRFRHHPNNRLNESMVVVDESSMVDLALMTRLFEAVRPEAHLVLLGDAEQLPSVEAGAVLRDLCAVDRELGAVTVRLTHSFRMDAGRAEGRAILELAQAIKDGRAELPIVRRRSAQSLSFSGAELLGGKDPAALRRDLLDRWQKEQVRALPEGRHLCNKIYRYAGGKFRPEDLPNLEAIFQHHARFKLLAITRGPALPTGAGALNGAIHQRALMDAGMSPREPFVPGEPVMMQRNDYQRGLFNGDQGVVLMVAAETELAQLMAVFAAPNGYTPFTLRPLQQDLDLAHALTVHKAQGSELDHAALVLPDVDLPLLTREILYTAVTRAKRSVVIAGAPELLVRAARRSIQRHSGLAERLSLSHEPE